MPQYMLLIHAPEDGFSKGETSAPWFAYTQALQEAGAHVAGNALQPADTATTLRVRGGETVISDGPFADTKEVFGGYYLVDADDIETAHAIAARIPATRMGGAVEVRALLEPAR